MSFSTKATRKLGREARRDIRNNSKADTWTPQKTQAQKQAEYYAQFKPVKYLTEEQRKQRKIVKVGAFIVLTCWILPVIVVSLIT